jgi:uncharacterized alpha-E superfamily protein
VRRLDDDYCDPVELRSDSTLGVPGLIGAVRAGRVVLANALGTGVLESAAWLGFLPGIAERLLGETLALPSIATWWCGERPALDYVLANLDHLVLKPTYPNQRFEPIVGRDLKGEARTRFVAKLKARPYAYVGQEHVALSQAPVWNSSGAAGFAPKAFTIRVYALATDAGVRVMPGGLARVATDVSADVVSTQRGGSTKDIWVLAQGFGARVEGPVHASQHFAARQDELPSRVVENLYWLGRYNVRCADKARVLRSTLAQRIDRGVWIHAVRICREIGALGRRSEPASGRGDERHTLAIVADVKRLAWCASQVRSRLSERYWRAVVSLQRLLQEAGASREDAREILERLLFSLSALTGFAAEDMTHDEGWRLMRLGRRLERLQIVAGLLGHHLRSQGATRQGHLEWLLDACGSVGIYRSRYVVAPRVAPILDLLVRDARHPVSLAFQFDSVQRDLHELAQALGGGVEPGISAPVPELSAEGLALLEVDGSDGELARRALSERLLALRAAAGDLSDRLSMRHFSHTSPRALAS